MIHPAITAKVLDFFQTNMLDVLQGWIEDLVRGNLYQIELSIAKGCRELFNRITELILPAAAGQILKEYPVDSHLKATLRPLRIRTMMGGEVSVPSRYYKYVPADYNASRHQIANHWKIIGHTSLGLCDRTGYLAMLAPSYDLAGQAFVKTTGDSISTSSVDKITTRLAARCHERGEENLALGKLESLAGKRVQIGVDGGRSRIRSYTGLYNEAGNATFETPWVEPKLFVIHVLDEQGELDGEFKPIYGCRFGDDESIEQLKKHLEKLQVHQAREVQIVADGAPWIWHRVKPMLIELGVDQSLISETIDHGHAVSYLHSLVAAMPKRIGKKARAVYLTEMKEALWQGDTDWIVLTCEEVFKRPSQLVIRWKNYFIKHHERMQYVDFETAKLSRGSGIVESAIRRVINLRFKNASTFWLPNKLEKLYFLRCCMLSGRWDTMMGNLTQSE